MKINDINSINSMYIHYIYIGLTDTYNLILNNMNTQVMQYNNILIVACWSNSDNKVYFNYFINLTQITDWNNLTKDQQFYVTLLVDNFCEAEHLTKWSY